MIEVGITQRILIHSHKIKEIVNLNNFISVNIEELQFPFGILIAGIILGFFIFTFELIIYHRYKRKIHR